MMDTQESTTEADVDAPTTATTTTTTTNEPAKRGREAMEDDDYDF